MHFIRKRLDYDTLKELNLVLTTVRDHILEKVQMNADSFFRDKAIKVKKQCRVIRNDLINVGQKLADTAEKITLREKANR